jgi:four helix bundle protein
LAKKSIALKECSETEFWLEVLHETNFLDEENFSSLISDCRELLSMIAAAVKTIKTEHVDPSKI